MFNLQKNKPSFRLRLPYDFLIERYVNAEDVGDALLNGYAANRCTSVCDAFPVIKQTESLKSTFLNLVSILKIHNSQQKKLSSVHKQIDSAS